MGLTIIEGGVLLIAVGVLYIGISLGRMRDYIKQKHKVRKK